MRKTVIAILLSVASYCAALQTPTLTYPYDNSMGQNVQLNLMVNKVTGANNYQWEVDTTSAMNSPFKQSFTSLSWSPMNSAYFQTVNQLMFGHVHYWRVRACSVNDTSAWSEAWQFTTTDATTLVSPADSTVGADVMVVMAAGKVDGCTSYIWEADTTPLFNSNLKKREFSLRFKSQSGGYAHDMRNLKFNRRYYWRVAMCNQRDTSSWSDVRWFETMSIPTLVDPADDTTGLNNEVEVAVRKIEGVTGYTYQISRTSSFSNPQMITGYNFDVNRTAYVDTFRGLLYNVKYYWRAKAHHSEDSSAWSATRSFRVTKSARLNSPENNNEGDVKRQVTLTVKPIAGTTMYIWQLDTTKRFNSLALQHDTSFNWNATQKLYTQFFANLDYGTVYYWRVKACSPNDTSAWSDTWKFTTVCNLPDAPELISPADNDTVYSANPTLKWKSIANAKKYAVELASDSLFSVVVRVENTADTTVSIKNLTRGTRYFWRVYGYNDAKMSPNSEVRSFALMGTGEAVETVAINQVALWPNPTDGIVYLGEEQAITVTDLNGRTMIKCFGSSVDISNMPAGIYLVNGIKVVKE